MAATVLLSKPYSIYAVGTYSCSSRIHKQHQSCIHSKFYAGRLMYPIFLENDVTAAGKRYTSSVYGNSSTFLRHKVNVIGHTDIHQRWRQLDDYHAVENWCRLSANFKQHWSKGFCLALLQIWNVLLRQLKVREQNWICTRNQCIRTLNLKLWKLLISTTHTSMSIYFLLSLTILLQVHYIAHS